MLVKIKITTPQPMPINASEHAFERFPVVIGRSAGCDLSLPDENKYVSSSHAEIRLANNQLSLTDTSANGTYVNNADTAVGRGNSVLLNDGDTLTMGQFTLHITVVASHESSAMHLDDPFGEIPKSNPIATDPSDPFAGLEDITPAQNSPLKTDHHIQRLEDIGIGPSAWEEDPNAAPADPFAHLNSPAASAPPPADPFAAPAGSGGSNTDDDDDWTGWLGSIPTTPASSGDFAASPKPSTPAPAAPSGQSGAALDTLLRSAGLDPAQFAGMDQNLLAEHIGGILRKSTQSMMLLLRSRDEIKNAMRADVTLLGSSSNSPLQFSISVEDALQKLLTPTGATGFTDANKAIDKGLQDIKIHQLAMLEAMRSALQIALSHFDPQVLEKQSREANPLASTLPLAKEAKLWEQFQSRYNVIRRETVDDFSDLFGKELRKAYEKSVQELKGPNNNS